MSQIRFYFSFARKVTRVTPLMFLTTPVTVAWVSGSIKRENKQKMGCPGIFAAYCISIINKSQRNRKNNEGEEVEEELPHNVHALLVDGGPGFILDCVGVVGSTRIVSMGCGCDNDCDFTFHCKLTSSYYPSSDTNSPNKEQ